MDSIGGGAPAKISQVAGAAGGAAPGKTDVAGAAGGAVIQTPGQTTPVQGGGGAAETAGALGLDSIKPILDQLTKSIAGITALVNNTAVAGASGGGAAAAPAKVDTPPAKVETPPAKDPATPVQGGGGAADAAAGAGALMPVLEQLIKAIEALTTIMSSQVAGASGGGAVTQAPGKDASDVAGANGGGAPGKVEQGTPGQVAGANGGAVEQEAPGKAPGKGADTAVEGANGGPEQAPAKGGKGGNVEQEDGAGGCEKGGKNKGGGKVDQGTPGQVAGENGGPVQGAPGKAPGKTDVAGAKGGPVQQAPQKDATQVAGAFGGADNHPFDPNNPIDALIMKDAQKNNITFEQALANNAANQGAAPQKIVLAGTKVGGAFGAPQKMFPSQVAGIYGAAAPQKFVQQAPTNVGGAWGGPVQQAPNKALQATIDNGLAQLNAAGISTSTSAA